jgi:4-hydroxy-2-oxoheptanedioate aldolase
MPIQDRDIRAFWKAGGVALGGWLNVPSPFVAELMAHAGWDVLTIDLQHGLMDYEGALQMLYAMAGTGVVPFARLPWNDPGLIMKMLDAGCLGIIAPTISTREDAERFVGACRYPPHGYRSIGPTRASVVYGSEYVDHAVDRVVTMALIETAEAIMNIEDIVNTPGLDAVLVGPSDLSRSLVGASGPAFSHPTVAEAIEQVFAAARRAKRVFGAYTVQEEDTLSMARKGAQYLPFSADSRILSMAARGHISRLRAGLG